MPRWSIMERSLAVTGGRRAYTDPMTGSVLQAEAGFTFRPLARRDYAMLRSWLLTPHVARWWADDSSDEGLEEHYGGVIDGTERAEVFIAERAGRAIGLAQRFRIDAYPE